MADKPTIWQLKVGRALSRWFIFLPIVILLSLAIYGKCLDDFPVPVAFVHFFPFSLGALFDQVWNGLWNFCRPTAMLIWRLGYALFENNYTGYRFILIFLHLTNVYLVLVFARRMLKNDLAAALSGLLFAVHPIHSEVVCLLASMYDASCLTFFLATMITFDMYLAKKRSNSPVRLLCLLTCVFELLCLGAKEVGIMLPVVMLAYDMLLHVKRPRIAATSAAAIKRSLPFLAILAGYLVFRLMRYEQNVGYASEFFRDPAGTLQNLVEYLRLTFFPNTMWVVFLIFLPFAKRRYLFSLLFMLLTIIPVLQIAPAERFCYIPSVGYCIAVAWCFTIGWHRIAEKFGLPERGRWLIHVGPLAACGIFLLQIPFAYLNTCTWSENYIPVRKTLQSIRKVVGIPKPGTVLYFANIEPLFNLSLLNGYDCTIKDRFRCEKLINYLFEGHQEPEFVFQMDGRNAVLSPDLAARCRQLESQLGRQKYKPLTLAWGRGKRPLSEWRIVRGDSDFETANAPRRSTDATLSFDLSKGPVKLISPVLNFSTLDVASVTLVGHLGQLSGETTCQLEWVVLPNREVISNKAAVIPVYKKMRHPSVELSAPWWKHKEPERKKRPNQISIDLGSRTDWVFERRVIERIAVKLDGSAHVTIAAIQLDPPAPSRKLNLEPVIQFHEHR